MFRFWPLSRLAEHAPMMVVKPEQGQQLPWLPSTSSFDLPTRQPMALPIAQQFGSYAISISLPQISGELAAYLATVAFNDPLLESAKVARSNAQ